MSQPTAGAQPGWNRRWELSRANIRQVLHDYLSLLNQLPPFEPSGSVIASLHALKRDPVGGGPYPRVSFFEAANRALSDITILLGVRQLLLDPVVGSVELPFQAYSAALGVIDGFDLTAGAGACRLVAEAFNLAPSYFQTKKARMLSKLRRRRPRTGW